MKYKAPEARTVYYYRPGQTPQNTKVSERALALIISQSAYDRLNDYGRESERVALLAEREAKRLAALRQATYEMSKHWNDTAQNIQKRRREELLSRKKVEEAERLEFTKEMAAKNAVERAEVVKQAKELLLWRKPQCRLINRALLNAECFRELAEQMKFREANKGARGRLEEEYARSVVKDVEKFREEEAAREAARKRKIMLHQAELIRQIEENREKLQKLEESISKAESEDQRNMTKELEELKRKELEEAKRKRDELRKMFLGAIEERRRYLEELQREEEFQDKNAKMFAEFKHEIQKLSREKARIAKEEKMRRLEVLGNKCYKRESRNEESRKQMEEKQRQEALEEKTRRKKQAREEMLEKLKKLEEEKGRRKKEEEDLKLWETMQRYKRDEFNKQWTERKREEEKLKRLEYGEVLKKQMAQKEAERRKQAIEDDDSVEMKNMINAANEKVLAYGEKVLQESRGVRPTYPIEKTIEQFKREAGLVPLIKKDYTEAPQAPRKKPGRRIVCNKTPSDENAFFFA